MAEAIPKSGQTSWSPAQIVRLESEWKKLRRAYALHPHVTVMPISGEPPGEYEVLYKLRTLTREPSGELAYVGECTLWIWLPPTFPHAAPVVHVVVALFHPNASGDWLHLSPPWNPATSSLTDLVWRCGEMLAFQVFDTTAIYNADAMQWITQYSHLVPTDPNAILSPIVGGDDGLARMIRLGSAAMDQNHAQLSEMSLAILESGPGTSPAEIRIFERRLVAALRPFGENDVPEPLRARAQQLDDWAQSLLAGDSTWEKLRTLAACSKTATGAIESLNETSARLETAIRMVVSLDHGQPSDDPRQTLAHLPAAKTLDPIAIKLRQAATAMEQHVNVLRGAADGLSAPVPAPLGEVGSLLHEQTSASIQNIVAKCAANKKNADDALAKAEPLLRQARAEQTAMQHLVAWADFTQLVRHGNELAQRLIERGAESIQAYHLHTDSGMFGPYQFEERIELGNVMLVARRIGAGSLEAFDARTMMAVGKGQGVADITFTDDTGAEQHAQIQATEHTDELRLQFDYLARTAREQLLTLSKHVAARPPTQSWAGRFSAALTREEAQHEASEVFRRANHRWGALLADLDELAQFKERVATYHLLARHVEFVPAVLAVRVKAQAAMSEANQRLSFIAARSTRDLETDHVVVPPEFARENMDRLAQRQRAEKDLAKVRKLISLVSAELQIRLANRRLQGKAGPPTLTLLPLPPDGFTGSKQWSSDEKMRSLVRELDRLLGSHLLEFTLLQQEND